METLKMVVTKETFDKLIPDIKKVSKKYFLRTKSDINKAMRNELDYWVSEVVGYNPIQEAIVLDCVHRIIMNIPTTTGLYDN